MPNLTFCFRFQINFFPKVLRPVAVAAKATSVLAMGGVATATGCSLFAGTGGASGAVYFENGVSSNTPVWLQQRKLLHGGMSPGSVHHATASIIPILNPYQAVESIKISLLI